MNGKFYDKDFEFTLNGTDYMAEVEASATYWSTRGDWNNPPESEFTIDEVNVLSVTDMDAEKEVEVTKEMEKRVFEQLENYDYEWEWD